MDFGTVTMQSDVLNNKLGQLHDALIGRGQPGDAARLIENESLICAKRIIAFTPPKTKKQGQDAVGRDLMKIFTPVSADMLNDVGSQFGVSGIDQWVTGANDKHTHLVWNRIDPTGAGMKAFHEANRNSRGRTRNLKKKGGTAWFAPYVVSFEDFQDYADKIKSHVGRRKAAWAKWIVDRGGSVASWILDHVQGAKGDFHNGLSVQNHPSVTLVSRAAGVGDDERIVRDAMRITANNISKKSKYILQGYAYDWKTGQVIRPQELRQAA
jgi:hypothetical protein